MTWLFLVLLGIFGTALSKQLSDDLVAWLPWLVERALRRAIRKLPATQRDRFEEEWRAHLNEIPGKIGPVVVAIGFVIASSKMSRLFASASLLGTPLDGFRAGTVDRFVKRSIDIAMSFGVLLLTAPILICAIVATAIAGGESVFFKQQRVTLGGRIFWLYKIRTMRDCAACEPKWHDTRDPRITPVGAILRRFRIDEIPQLINVLNGDMSMVGPRAEQPVFVERLSQEIPFYNLRHTVKAGITGWAQINYPYGASKEDAVRKFEYDLDYIKKFSLRNEILIVLTTLRILFWPPL